MTDKTPHPGCLLEAPLGKAIRASVEDVFRPRTLVSSTPTACLMEGRKIERLDDVEAVTKDESVYLLFESSGEVWETNINSVQHYLEIKNPWEDYDLLVFPPNLAWCIAVSHNRRILFKKAPSAKGVTLNQSRTRERTDA